MGQGHEHWQIFGEERIITCNAQRGDASTLINLVQPLPKLYNLLSKRKKIPNATVLVRRVFFRDQTLEGGGGTKICSGHKSPSTNLVLHRSVSYCLDCTLPLKMGTQSYLCGCVQIGTFVAYTAQRWHPHTPQAGEGGTGGVRGGGVRKGRFGGPHTTRCTHKAAHTPSSMWPPHESCYLRGVRGLAPSSSEASRLSSVASRRVGGGVRGGGVQGGTGGRVRGEVQSSFKLQQFLCSRGYAMDNLDEAQRIHPS